MVADCILYEIGEVGRLQHLHNSIFVKLHCSGTDIQDVANLSRLLSKREQC